MFQERYVSFRMSITLDSLDYLLGRKAGGALVSRIRRGRVFVTVFPTRSVSISPARRLSLLPRAECTFIFFPMQASLTLDLVRSFHAIDSRGDIYVWGELSEVFLMIPSLPSSRYARRNQHRVAQRRIF